MDRGYDKLYGARPMGRLIQEKIKQPLAEELLFGKLVHGGEVRVYVKPAEEAKGDEPATRASLAFEITPAPPKPAKGSKGGSKAKAETGKGPAKAE